MDQSSLNNSINMSPFSEIISDPINFFLIVLDYFLKCLCYSIEDYSKIESKITLKSFSGITQEYITIFNLSVSFF